MRDSSAALCDEFTGAEAECFRPWCDLFGRRAQPGPDTIVASQAGLHAAAVSLRDWCLAAPAAAEAERRELMVRQAEGEISAAAAVRAHRSAEDRERIRRDWVTARWAIVCQRDALTCGLGWPHRGERVTVSTWYYETDGSKVPVTGDGIYLGDYDVFNVSHEVWVPSLSASRRAGTLLVRWLPDGAEDDPPGPADPAGDIGLRVLAAPGRRLPIPLMRWPAPADAGLSFPPPHMPPAQPALFAAEMPPPADRRGRASYRQRERQRGPGGQGEEEWTLF